MTISEILAMFQPLIFKKVGAVTYESDCGTFRIINMGKCYRPCQWTLFVKVEGADDHQRSYATLRQAKNAVARYTRGGLSQI